MIAETFQTLRLHVQRVKLALQVFQRMLHIQEEMHVYMKNKGFIK